MPVGRKPKPTHLKLPEGEKNKDRINRNEPKPTPIAPKCPKHLGKEAKKQWKLLAPELERIGLLTKIDGATFAAACQAYDRWVQAEKWIQKTGFFNKTPNGSVQISPALSIANRAMDQLRKFCSELGMTPTSRARISIKPESDEDEWAGILD